MGADEHVHQRALADADAKPERVAELEARSLRAWMRGPKGVDVATSGAGLLLPCRNAGRGGQSAGGG